MIYTIAEYVATITENAIAFIFLLNTLHLKEMSDVKKYGITITMFMIHNLLVFTLNSLYIMEGVLNLFYLINYMIYCRLVSKDKIWFQLFVSCIIIAVMQIIAITFLTVTANIMNMTVEQLVLIKNPLRIFTLAFTKILLVLFLYVIRKFIKKCKINFSMTQYIGIILFLFISMEVGMIYETMKLENELTALEFDIISMCIILIICLFIFVIYLIASQNNERIKNELYKMQIESEKKNMEQAVMWNNKIETIRHDMKNHLYCISDLASKNENERVINYIEKILEKTVKTIPNQVCTNHTAFNAVINLKKSQCDEKEIDFKCFVPETLPDFDDMDLCIVVANLLDNAIEAEMTEEFPMIEFSISEVGNYLSIKIKNRISKSVLQDNKKLKTTKKDKEHHGLGILSVVDVVEQNDGMYEFYEEKNLFVANVMLKLSSIKK